MRLDTEGLTALEKLGTVAHILKLGSHGQDDAFYKDRYPNAKIWAPKNASWAQEEPSPDVKLEEVVNGTPSLPFDGELFFFEGLASATPEYALILPSKKLLVTVDSVQNMESGAGISWKAYVFMWIKGFIKRSTSVPLG